MSALLALFLAFGSAALASPPEPSCASPRSAADSLLAWLQPDDWDPVRAAACVQEPDGMEGQGPELAVSLKQVLDARGHWVPVPSLSDEPDYTDEDGRELVPLVDELPEVYLVKDGDDWLYSAETMAAAPRLHDETFTGFVDGLKTRVPPWSFGAVALWQLVYAAALVSVGLGVGWLVNLSLRQQVVVLVRRLGLPFDAKAFARTRRPLRWLVLGVIVYWGIPGFQGTIVFTQFVQYCARALISLSAVFIAIRWIDVYAGIFETRARKTSTRMDDQLVPLLTRGAKVVVAALGVVFVLENTLEDVGSLIAGLGIGGLAIALAAQQTLANLFGSLTIFLDRPFHVGDWVVLPGGVEGTVEEIGFRSTRVRTFYNSVVTVPNGDVAGGVCDNMGAREYRRCKATLGVTYDTPPDVLDAFVVGIRAILKANPKVRQDAYEVHFRDFGPSSLDIMLYFFFDVPDWHQELEGRSQVFLEILRLAEELGVKFAFPSTSLYVESTPDRPMPARSPVTADTLREQVTAFGPGGARARPGGPQLVPHGFHATAGSQRGDSGE